MPPEMGEVAYPEFEILLHYTEAQRNDYIKNYDRETIRTAWEDDLYSESEHKDQFWINFGDAIYLITVRYNANNTAQSIAISQVDEPTMGDVSVQDLQ